MGGWYGIYLSVYLSVFVCLLVLFAYLRSEVVREAREEERAPPAYGLGMVLFLVFFAAIWPIVLAAFLLTLAIWGHTEERPKR